MSDRDAVARVAKKTFRRFHRGWRNYLYKRNLKMLPDHAFGRLMFRDGSRPDDALKGIPELRARTLTYLGDRLAVKKRYKAATKEYTKALSSAGLASPMISAKLASVLFKQGKHKQVVKVVTPAIRLNPNHVLLHLYRAKAQFVFGKYEHSQRDLTRVLRLNPFDPEVHGLMARVLTQLGRPAEAERERRYARLVSGR
jgi:Flp pilus assembly protein TadD